MARLAGVAVPAWAEPRPRPVRLVRYDISAKAGKSPVMCCERPLALRAAAIPVAWNVACDRGCQYRCCLGAELVGESYAASSLVRCGLLSE
jgi:hypothetical protein